MILRPAAGIALTLLGLVETSCGSPSAPPAPPPVAAHTSTVHKRAMAVYESLDGQVTPFLQANLAPQQSGTLTAIYVNEGDRVSKGQTLAKIDDSILRADLTQQQGVSTQNSAKLAQSQIQLPITNVTARSGVTQAQGALEQARKTQTADAANVSNTKLTYDADTQLSKQGYVASSVYQQARAAYVLAQQTLDSDNDKIAQAQAALRTARGSLANTPLQQQVIVENRGAVTQAEGSVTQLKTAVAQTTIVAPFDGVVTARSLDPGSYASPSQSIYAISQLDPTYVDFNVKDTDLQYVRVGTSVSFATSANPSRRYQGRVASIDSVPTSGTLLYRARIVERNPDLSLRGGLQVAVRVTTQSHPDALTVPRAAIIQQGTAGTLYTLTSDGNHYTAKQTHVKIGLQNSSFVEVSGGGIEDGTPIVVDQTDNLHDGIAIAKAAPHPSSSSSATP